MTPKGTAKKLFALSPLGAAYTLHKGGYDMHNISGKVRTRIEKYMVKLAEKAEVAMVASVIWRGNSTAGGGNFLEIQGSGCWKGSVGGAMSRRGSRRSQQRFIYR